MIDLLINFQSKIQDVRLESSETALLTQSNQSFTFQNE